MEAELGLDAGLRRRGADRAALHGGLALLPATRRRAGRGASGRRAPPSRATRRAGTPAAAASRPSPRDSRAARAACRAPCRPRRRPRSRRRSRRPPAPRHLRQKRAHDSRGSALGLWRAGFFARTRRGRYAAIRNARRAAFDLLLRFLATKRCRPFLTSAELSYRDPKRLWRSGGLPAFSSQPSGSEPPV